MSIASQLMPEFEQELSNTRKILACIPDEQLDWKPHAKSMTLGRLAGHVAEMPSWAVSALTSDTLDLTTPPGQTMQANSAKSASENLAYFDQQVEAARAALSKASDEYIEQTWTLTFQGRTLVSMPRTRVLRHFVLSHMIHHRAQLGVYLRLLDVAIPGMYGPSADESKMMSAS